MNTLENSCFQFKENDEASKECIRIMKLETKSERPVKDNDYCWLSGINTLQISKRNLYFLKVVSPSDYLALLTGKQLTEGDFAHVSEHQSAMEYLQTPSLKEMESQPELLPTQESVKDGSLGIVFTEQAENAFNHYEYPSLINTLDTSAAFWIGWRQAEIFFSTQQTAHLQQQLKEAKDEIEKLKRITSPRSLYDENGNCRICGQGGMNTLANTCFQYDGSDDSKNIIRIMNKNHRSDFKGNDKYFYWIANDIADTFYKMDKDLTEIPPYEYLALLTGKQLTEADLIVGNRFECIEKRHDSFSLFTRGCTHTCEINGTITDSMGREVRLDNEALNRHFKLLPQESVKERNGDPSMYDMIQLVEQLESDKFHLQQQLKELQENAEMDSLTIHSLRTQLLESFKESNSKTEQLKEAKELLTLFADAKGVYQDNINKANQFLTRNK